MTTEINSNYWHKILQHYQNLLTENFQHTPLTPLVQHHMESFFQKAVHNARRNETHPAWHVPLVLKFKPLEHSVSVEPADPNSLKLL